MKRAVAPLTAEQAATLLPLLAPGVAVLGRVMREPFTLTRWTAHDCPTGRCTIRGQDGLTTEKGNEACELLRGAFLSTIVA